MTNNGVANSSCNCVVEVSPAEVDVVKPHVIEINIWDVPSATVAGERFTVALGVRCSAGCDLGGRELRIVDQEGAQAGTVQLGHDIWPGSEALYFSKLEARAPLAEGNHQWVAKIAGWDAELPHTAGSFPLTIRVVSTPDCEVTVRAIDREKQTPIKGACVVMHPYRALTDDNGVARVRVAKGPYDILVSGSRYMPVCASVEVSADMITSAELDTEEPWAAADEVTA